MKPSILNNNQFFPVSYMPSNVTYRVVAANEIDPFPVLKVFSVVENKTLNMKLRIW